VVLSTPPFQFAILRSVGLIATSSIKYKTLKLIQFIADSSQSDGFNFASVKMIGLKNVNYVPGISPEQLKEFFIEYG